MKKTIYIAAVLFALSACNKSVIDAPSEYGYIDFNLSADNTIKVDTRAGDDDYSYDVSDFTVKFGGNSYKYSELTGPVRIATGTYTIEAENCTLAEGETGNGMLRMYDSESVTVLANKAATATLRCSPMSSEVNLVYSDTYKSLYPESVFTLVGTRNSVAGARLALEEGTPVYYNNTSDGIVNVSYEIKAMGDASDAKTTFGGTLALKNAYSLTITVDVQNANGQIIIDLKATDTLTGESSTIVVDPYSGTSSVQ